MYLSQTSFLFDSPARFASTSHDTGDNCEKHSHQWKGRTYCQDSGMKFKKILIKFWIEIKVKTPDWTIDVVQSKHRD